jgi:hypothetical protein
MLPIKLSPVADRTLRDAVPPFLDVVPDTIGIYIFMANISCDFPVHFKKDNCSGILTPGSALFAMCRLRRQTQTPHSAHTELR